MLCSAEANRLKPGMKTGDDMRAGASVPWNHLYNTFVPATVGSTRAAKEVTPNA